MPITLYPGEIKQVNAALTPVPSVAAIVFTGFAWFDNTANKRTDIPVPVGHSGHGKVDGINNTDVEVMFDVHMWYVDPTGAIRYDDREPCYNRSKTAGIPPGGTFGVTSYPDVALDIVGTWHFHARAELIPESNPANTTESEWLLPVA